MKTNRREIKFRKSLFRFSTAFTIVIVAGLITNTVIKEIPLEKLILDSVQLPPNYSLEIHQPEVRFKRGLLPILGVNIERLTVRQENCAVKQVLAQNILLTLDWWKLVGGQLKARWIGINYLKVDYPRSCRDFPLADGVADGRPNDQPASQVTKKNAPIKEENLRSLFAGVGGVLETKRLSGFSVDHLEVNYLESMDKEISVKSKLTVRLADEIKLTTALKSVNFRGYELPIHSSTVEARLNPQRMELKLNSLVREGKVDLKFELQNQERWPTSLEVNVDKLPLSSLSLLWMGENQITYLWASCGVTQKSHWASMQQDRLEFGACKVDGPYGTIAVEKIEASLSQLHELKLELNKLKLDQIIKSRRQLYFSGVFESFGTLSQKLHFKDNQLSTEGFLEDSALLFSKSNLRDIQRLKKIPFFFKGNRESWQAELSNIEIDNGEIEGKLQMQLPAGQSKAQGKITIHRLVLSPRIYKLMLKAEPSIMQIYGKFELEKGRLGPWSVLAVTPELKGETYDFSNLKVKAEGEEEKSSQIQISATKGHVLEDSKLVEWIDATTLDKKWESPKAEFSELFVKLELFKDKSLSWQRGYLRLDDGWQMSSEGHLDSNQNIQAWLQWDRPQGRYMKWDYQGQFFKGTWHPETPWVRDWLGENGDFLKRHQDIVYQVTTEPGGDGPSKANAKPDTQIEKGS